MKLSHEGYLKQTLNTRKNELENLNINHMVAIAEYNARKEMLTKQINSIERQLAEGKA